ncbi:MAG: sodium:alanine symporter family protein [Eubacteriales bacterium]|nr:sodium:alanine symporter family protein [Eubacteriales bacterium]
MEAVIGKILGDLGTFLFGPVMLAVFFGVGLYFTIRLGGVQFTRFKTAFREVVLNVKRKSDDGVGEIRSYKALATALSSCVGNGNVVGVAYAIAVGGPGAIFWMWVAALGGMATKFAEIALAMHYRVQDEDGNFRGGVMYILTQGMKQKTIAKLLGGAFAVFTVFVSVVSCGALQVNTINSAVTGLVGAGSVIPWIIAGLILLIDGLVIFGGVKKIADVTTYLTPIMAIIYLGFGLIILLMNITLVPQALWFIVKSAFTGDAVIGGVAGATMAVAIRRGVQRGVFSNEAGTGSSAMVHATAKVDVPVKQALYGIIEVFFDTFVICTFTALIIMVSGVWNSGVTDGTVLAATAFRQNLGSIGQVVIVVSLILFCLSTVLGWYTYGESAFVFLFGNRRVKIYRILHMLISSAGALISVQLLWDAADVCNGLMAIPNLFSLILFGGVVVKDTRDFFAEYDRGGA